MSSERLPTRATICCFLFLPAEKSDNTMFFSKQFIQEPFNIMHESLSRNQSLQEKNNPTHQIAIPYISSQPRPISPVHVTAVHWPESSLIIWSDLASWCTCAALRWSQLIFRCMRKSGASHKTWLQSQAPSWDCCHTHSPHLPLLYVLAERMSDLGCTLWQCPLPIIGRQTALV